MQTDTTADAQPRTHRRMYVLGTIVVVVLVAGVWLGLTRSKRAITAQQLEFSYSGPIDKLPQGTSVSELNANIRQLTQSILNACYNLQWALTHGDVSRHVDYDIYPVYSPASGCVDFRCDQYGWKQYYELSFRVLDQEPAFLPSSYPGRGQTLHFYFGISADKTGISYASANEDWMCGGSLSPLQGPVFVPIR